MGSHEPDERNPARDGNGGSGKGNRRQKQGDAFLFNGHSDADGDRFAQFEQIQPMGFGQRKGDEHSQPRQEGPDERPVGSPNASREPFGDELDERVQLTK